MKISDVIKGVIKDFSGQGSPGVMPLNYKEALEEMTKIVEQYKKGAYKKGYHDALNGRPYKI